MWIDAKVVCQWLSQYNIKDTYIHNRVKQIRELMYEGNTFIRYIPSDLNPADKITKEQDTEKFVSDIAWFGGPDFLTKKNEWPPTEEEYKL